MSILALDLGTASTKTYVHILDTETGEIQRQSFPTSLTEFLAILRRIKPDQVVVEPTPITGLLVDLCQAENIQVKVANVRDPAWQNRTNAGRRNPMPNPTRSMRLSLEQGQALIDALVSSGMTAAAFGRSKNLDPRRLEVVMCHCM